MTAPGKRPGVWTVLLLLAGCASVPPDGGVTDVQQLVRGKTATGEVTLSFPSGGQNRPALAELLEQPLTQGAAVRIALLNNPGLQASLAALGVSDADRAQMGRVPNPTLSLGRFTEGDRLEIERVLRFDVMGLLTLPWRNRMATQAAAQDRLQAAQDVIRLAANTRKAWINAVADRQTTGYLRDVRDAAQAGAELARRLAQVGNWNRLNQAREQSLLADATAQLARSEQAAFASRERLIRLMGLWGEQTTFTLPARLPDLPVAVPDITDVESRAIGQRLDVRAAMEQAAAVADALGFTKATGVINALDLGYTRSTTFDNAAGTQDTRRGWSVELPVPVFDWGQARTARAQAVYLQSVAQVRAAAVNARSEAREAYHAYRTSYDLARHYRDEVVPLRRFIQDEVLLRYNGMISSVFELLGETRTHVLAVSATIEAQRDFWLADTDLQTALTGTTHAGQGSPPGDARAEPQ